MPLVRAKNYSVVSITSPNLAHARKLSKKLLLHKLCACVHIVPSIESHYWWKGKIHQTAEVWLIVKTQRSKLKKMEKMILENHPYGIPEILEIALSSGSKNYLQWVRDSIL